MLRRNLGAALIVALVLCFAASIAWALGGGTDMMMGSASAPSSGPLPIPASITLTSGSVSDGSTNGTSIAALNSSDVTMTNGGSFSGTCSVTDTNTTGPGPGGTYVQMSGCVLQTAGNYSSANDGTHGNITLHATQNGTTISQAFSLSIMGAAPAAAIAGCSSSNVGYNGTGSGGPTNGSCLNTLALNMDFTTSAPVSGLSNGTKFNAQVISNWLNCANTSQLWVSGSIAGDQAPCPGSWSIVNDGGTQALLMSSSVFGAMSTNVAFPDEFYVQFTYRTDATSIANCNGESNCQDIWSYTGQNTGYTLEWDFLEQGGGNNSGAAAGGGSNLGLYSGCQSGGGNCYWDSINWAGFPTSPPSFNTFQYHTLGIRLTQDGNGTAAACYYYDGTQYLMNTDAYEFAGNCGAWKPADMSSIADGHYLQSMATPVAMIVWNATCPSNSCGGTINLYLEKFQVWSCPNWNQVNTSPFNGFACAGAVMVSDP